MVDEGRKIIELEKEIADLKAEIAVLKAKNAESQKKSKVIGGNIPAAAQPMKRFLEESSDLNAKEDAKKLKLAEKSPTNVPNWLIEVLAWIGRIEMANSSLSFSTWTFSQLCWPKLHGNVVKPHSVKPLRFVWKRNDELGVLQAKLLNNIGADIPIASVPPPNYIIGFTEITINFFDGQLLKFIECVQPILNEIRLYFHLRRISVFDFPCPVATGSGYFIQIRCLFKILSNKAVLFSDPPFFDFLSSYPNATSIVKNFLSITTKLYNASNFDLLIKWLAESWIDKKPKWLHIYYSKDNTLSDFIDGIKERFISSTLPANFIITSECQYDLGKYPNFVLENEQTGELLATYPTRDNKKLIARHPKSSDIRLLWPNWKRQIKMAAKASVVVQIQQIGNF